MIILLLPFYIHFWIWTGCKRRYFIFHFTQVYIYKTFNIEVMNKKKFFLSLRYSQKSPTRRSLLFTNVVLIDTPTYLHPTTALSPHYQRLHPRLTFWRTDWSLEENHFNPDFQNFDFCQVIILLRKKYTYISILLQCAVYSPFNVNHSFKLMQFTLTLRILL